MYFDFLIEIPKDTGKISLNRRDGTSDVEYTYGRTYIPEKKYNVPKRTTIDMMKRMIGRDSGLFLDLAAYSKIS